MEAPRRDPEKSHSRRQQGGGALWGPKGPTVRLIGSFLCFGGWDGAAAAMSGVHGAPIEVACPIHPPLPPASFGWQAVGILLLFLLVAALCTLVAVAALRQAAAHHAAVTSAVELEGSSPEDSLFQLQRLFRENLPGWLHDPSVVRQPAFINAAMVGLWPHLSAAAARAAKRGQLEALLNSSEVWRPRMLARAHIQAGSKCGPGQAWHWAGCKCGVGLVDGAGMAGGGAARLSGSAWATGCWCPPTSGGTALLQVQGVYLGQVPPRVSGVRVVGGEVAYAAEAPLTELALEFDFSWKSGMEVMLLVSLLPQQVEDGRQRRGLLWPLWALLSHAVVVKVRRGGGAAGRPSSRRSRPAGRGGQLPAQQRPACATARACLPARSPAVNETDGTFVADPAQVGLRDLVVRGTMCATLRPLLSELPIVGAMQLSFMGPPGRSVGTAQASRRPRIGQCVWGWVGDVRVWRGGQCV